MKRLITCAVTVGLMAGVAYAGPATDMATIAKAPTLMTDDQMDKVVAGSDFTYFYNPGGQHVFTQVSSGTTTYFANYAGATANAAGNGDFSDKVNWSMQ